MNISCWIKRDRNVSTLILLRQTESENTEPILTNISYWSLMEHLWNHHEWCFQSKGSSTRHIVGSTEPLLSWNCWAAVIARISSLLELCGSAFTWLTMWKLSEQKWWQARVSDRLDRPLHTVNLPFKANTYGLSSVRHIVLAQLQCEPS